MKLRKVLSTLVLTTIMMLTLVITGKAAVTVSYDVTPSENSVVRQGDKIVVVATLSDKTLGFKASSISLYDGTTNEYIRTNPSNITDTVHGNNPVTNEIIIPPTCTSTSLKAVVNATDMNGTSHTETFTFVGPKTTTTTETENNGSTGNVLTITASVTSGSVISPKQVIQFKTNSSNLSVGTKTTEIWIYNNKTSELVDYKSATASSEIGANPLIYNKTMPEAAGTYKVVVKSVDIVGTIATKTFYYTINDDADEEDEEDEDDDDDDDDYEGIIDPELEGLVIDLWLREDTRFYELEEDDIPFVAYYYNADKKSKDDVNIEVEIPDGFEVVSKSTEYGSVKVKNDTIIYTIGTVPSKELRKVYFTLKATDDDVCEVATNVVAVILEDDDEEDQSTQRVWVYEEDGEGSFTAYVTGYPNGKFGPDQDITREEVAAVMARAFNHTTINTNKEFTDIKKTSWSYNYIMACTTKGIITGYSNGTFQPYKSITRAELYAMTYRAMDIPTTEKALFVPKAYKNSDSWEKNYIAGLVRLQMLEDMDDRDADEEASRAEVVYLVNGVQFRNPSKMMDVEYTDLSSSHWCAKGIAAASVTYKFKRGEGGKEIVINK